MKIVIEYIIGTAPGHTKMAIRRNYQDYDKTHQDYNMAIWIV